MPTHGERRDETIHNLRWLIPFQRRGYNMRMVEGAADELGRLPHGIWRAHYRAYRRQVIRTVLSYDTPIAWVVQCGPSIVPVLPVNEHGSPFNYSRTTSTHTVLCATYLAQGLAGDVNVAHMTVNAEHFTRLYGLPGSWDLF